MDDYRWLRLAQQKADKYQAAAERHALVQLHQTGGALAKPARSGFRRELAKVLFKLAARLSPDRPYTETRPKSR